MKPGMCCLHQPSNGSPSVHGSHSVGSWQDWEAEHVCQIHPSTFLYLFCLLNIPRKISLTCHRTIMYQCATSPRGIQFKGFLELCSERFGILYGPHVSSSFLEREPFPHLPCRKYSPWATVFTGTTKHRLPFSLILTLSALLPKEKTPTTLFSVWPLWSRTTNVRNHLHSA